MEKDIPLVSLQSTSKGYYGECGRRGGYMEVNGFDEKVKDELYKLAAVGLCPNLSGQIVMGLVMSPPVEGDDSYPLLLGAGRDRDPPRRASASTPSTGLNLTPRAGRATRPRARCRFSQDRPAREARRGGRGGEDGAGRDVLHEAARQATGIVVVPGSGFGQVEGTWHFRTTFLPAEAEIEGVVAKISVQVSQGLFITRTGRRERKRGGCRR